MTDKTNNPTDNRLRYWSPKINVIEVNVHSVLCLSGNDPMLEVDFGNGGFE